MTNCTDACEQFKDSNKLLEIPETGIGDLSDGYHTFNELYHHRAILFSIICNMFPDKAWKSKLHDTGDMFEGMFIVGIDTTEGQATYHYDIEPYWDMFKVKELDRAPTWDGHTPEEAINRIATLHMTGNETSCEFCEFDHPEKDFEIELYEATSYKYEGKKYYLEVTYPADGKRYHNIKRVEAFYCPKCGRKLNS